MAKKIKLKPLTTPWDNMPHQELVREMQKAYSALLSARGVLLNVKETSLNQTYWTADAGRGRHAIVKVETVFTPYRNKFVDYEFYSEFFRTCDPLLFPELGENWVVCSKCGTMTHGMNDAEKIGKTCSEGNFLGQGNCDGILDWMSWADIEKWKKVVEGNPDHKLQRKETNMATKPTPVVVSDREKSIIVALAKAGVETPVLAKAFGIPKQAVSAFKAWNTMRSN